MQLVRYAPFAGFAQREADCVFVIVTHYGPDPCEVAAACVAPHEHLGTYRLAVGIEYDVVEDMLISDKFLVDAIFGDVTIYGRLDDRLNAAFASLERKCALRQRGDGAIKVCKIYLPACFSSFYSQLM